MSEQNELSSPRAREFLEVFRRTGRSDLALFVATTEASYWEPRACKAQPDSIEEISKLSENAWWTRGFEGPQSTLVSEGFPPPRTGVADRLRTWNAEAATYTGREERRRPAKRSRGAWWSTPDPAGVCCTYGPGYGLPAVGLSFVEDDFGALEAEVVRVAEKRELKVREIFDAKDWVQLVEEFPLDVSASRSATWFDNTGIEARWFLPDYAALSETVDVIHLNTIAYLRIAGVPLKAQGGLTMLAGWNPDASYWLTDSWRRGDSETWIRSDSSSLAWSRTK